VIEQLKQTQEILVKLLALLEASEADKFVAHLYHSRRQYRRTSERPNKGNKAIEREVISSYQVAQSLGFNGDFRAWETLAADSRIKKQNAEVQEPSGSLL
jgi:cell division protein FtsB